MADQRDVQQLIQSLVPASGNAGNPNTAYNNPTPDAWLQGWNGPQVSPAASLGPTNLAGQTVTIPALTLPAQVGNAWNQPIPQLPGIRLPSFTTGGQPGGSWGITRPDVTPTNPVIPPGVQPGTGPVAPPADTPVDVGIPVDWDALLGGGGGGGDPGTWAPPGVGSPGFGGGLPSTSTQNTYGGSVSGTKNSDGTWNFTSPSYGGFGSKGSTESGLLQFIDAVTEPWTRGDWYNPNDNRSLWQQLGIQDQQGKIDWKQGIDMATQIFLPANLYLSNLGRWDASNAVVGVLDRFTGGLGSKVLNKWGASLSNKDPSTYNWLERLVVDHWQDSAMNMLEGLIESPEGAMDRYRDTWLNDMLNTQQQQFRPQDLPYEEPIRRGIVTVGDLQVNPTDNAWSSPMDDRIIMDMMRDFDLTSRNSYSSFGTEREFSSGCVTLESFIYDGSQAENITLGSVMDVIDATTYQLGKDTVTMAEPKLMPCVRITTEHGVELECSTTAPIADKHGNQILAPDLLDVEVPTMVDGRIQIERVVSVEPIGDMMVMHVTVGNKFFPAGKAKGRFLLHHNVKAVSDDKESDDTSNWEFGSTSFKKKKK